jgi:hypothetical protein
MGAVVTSQKIQGEGIYKTKHDFSSGGCPASGLLKIVALFNSKRLHQLQKIFGFEPQQLGCGGAIAVGRGKRLHD